MFNVPPIRDTQRTTLLRNAREIRQIEPVAPFPRIEATGHRSNEPNRPAAVEERLRRDKGRRPTARDAAADPEGGETRGRSGERSTARRSATEGAAASYRADGGQGRTSARPRLDEYA
ncbi:hypothetical protein CKO15_10945 [Halorhodospira abdelmalekii]|uniref:hypothetical protein n=1 Tax=Halorhodospira abdelmalekii TaxID=421629 RepID=UPI001904D467|nr:hypothetical protein [Halorhodospira abdelmalekii]MBK1735785.1 hypothetical protein [Halorhodospira abdelmalekii]